MGSSHSRQTTDVHAILVNGTLSSNSSTVASSFLVSSAASSSLTASGPVSKSQAVQTSGSISLVISSFSSVTASTSSSRRPKTISAKPSGASSTATVSTNTVVQVAKATNTISLSKATPVAKATASSNTTSSSTTSTITPPSSSATSSGSSSTAMAGTSKSSTEASNSTPPQTLKTTKNVVTSAGSSSPVNVSSHSSAGKSSSSSTAKTSTSTASHNTSSTHASATSSSKNNVAAPASATSTVIVATTTTPTSTTKILTSTITPTPISTFSVPVSLTVTDPLNGHTTLTTPAVVTTESTAIGTGGATTIITYVIANPTAIFANGANSDVSTGTSFFQHRGVVAGVFVVVGVVVAAASACCFVLWRRRSRVGRSRRIRDAISWPQNRFAEDGSPTPMSYANLPSNRSTYVDVEPALTTPPPSARPFMTTQPSWERSRHLPNRVVPASQLPDFSPFDDAHAVPLETPTSPIGVALTSEEPIQLAAMRSRIESLAQSSPSLYPATLPMGDDDVDSLYEQEATQSPLSPEWQQGNRSTDTVTASARGETPSSASHAQSSTLLGSPVDTPAFQLPSPIARKPIPGFPMTSLLDQDVNEPTFQGELKRVLSQSFLNRPQRI